MSWKKKAERSKLERGDLPPRASQGRDLSWPPRSGPARAAGRGRSDFPQVLAPGLGKRGEKVRPCFKVVILK